MNLAQLTTLYSEVLRQLLPTGGYDIAPATIVAVDIEAHAKALALADLDAKRILTVIDAIPPELVSEFERDYGLPLKCSLNTSLTLAERLAILNDIVIEQNVINKAYLTNLLARFGVVLLELVNYKPIQCIAPCTSAVNTEQLRYRVTLQLQAPVLADINCIIEHYLPAYVRYDIVEI